MSDLHCAARLYCAPSMPEPQVLARLRPVAVHDAPGLDLDELADRHRGETVLVVGPHPYGDRTVLVEVDADGRRVTEWDVDHDEVRHT